MSRFIDSVLDLFYPTKCVLCRKKLPPGIPSICPACQEAMPRAKSFHLKGDFFSECVAALYYEGDVKDAILRFKFGGAQAYRHAFGELLAELIYESLDGQYDVLTWTPLAPDRLRRRGYDQVKLIAEDAAGRLRRELTPLLTKKRGVGPQSLKKGKPERRANIAGAYRLRPGADVEGKRVLIIDDIVTTGSTLSECAKVLLMAGAEKVICATLAAASHS